MFMAGLDKTTELNLFGRFGGFENGGISGGSEFKKYKSRTKRKRSDKKQEKPLTHRDAYYNFYGKKMELTRSRFDIEGSSDFAGETFTNYLERLIVGAGAINNNDTVIDGVSGGVDSGVDLTVDDIVIDDFAIEGGFEEDKVITIIGAGRTIFDDEFDLESVEGGGDDDPATKFGDNIEEANFGSSSVSDTVSSVSSSVSDTEFHSNEKIGNDEDNFDLNDFLE